MAGRANFDSDISNISIKKQIYQYQKKKSGWYHFLKRLVNNMTIIYFWFSIIFGFTTFLYNKELQLHHILQYSSLLQGSSQILLCFKLNNCNAMQVAKGLTSLIFDTLGVKASKAIAKELEFKPNFRKSSIWKGVFTGCFKNGKFVVVHVKWQMEPY